MAFGLLLIHGVAGAIVAAHGVQKLFGWFGGSGLEGTARGMESLGLAPGKRMAATVGLNELTGGLSLAIGFMTPVAATLIAATMLVAARTAHAGKGPWFSRRGWEYVLVIAAVAIGVGFTGPGAWSVDAAISWHVSGLGCGAGAAIVAVIGGIGVLAARRPAGDACEAGKPLSQASHLPPGSSRYEARAASNRPSERT